MTSTPSSKPARGLVEFCARRPWLVIAASLLLTAAFALQLPKMTVDTDPTHMLPADFPVRRYNEVVEKQFSLHRNVIVVGMVSERPVLLPDAQAALGSLTEAIKKIPGVVARDVTSLATVDDMTGQDGTLTLRPLLPAALASPEQALAFTAG